MIKAALLSVIIPVYNVEPYLEQCLDSVVNQTYKNLEIICINDGSTDNSLKILEKYQKKDSRIKLINQKNQGAAVARNAGLDSATGGYITFVDSDDYLELNAYEEAMKAMLNDNKNLDLLEFRERAFYLESNEVNKNRSLCITNWFEREFQNKRHNVVIWNKIFKLELIRKFQIRFIEGAIHDDNFFSAAYEVCTENCSFLNLRLYNYRIRSNSIGDGQYKMQYNKVMDIFYNYDDLITFSKKNIIYHKNKERIYFRYIDQIYNFCNDKNRLLEAAFHWDKKILNSNCPHDLKLKYIEKRDAIIYAVEHPFEYECYKIFSKLCNFFDIIK